MAKNKASHRHSSVVDRIQSNKGLMATLKKFGGRVAAGLAQAAAIVTGEDKEKSPEELRRAHHRAHYANTWPGFTQRIPTPGKRRKYGKGRK